MRISKSLAITAAMLALPACAVYVHDQPERPYRPCPHAGRVPGEPRLGVIGISIGRAGQSRRGPIVVERVVEGSPAANADVRPGDRLRAIDGESTRGMTVSEAARLIRGRADTSVELRVDSPRGSRLVTLVRVPPHAIWGERGHWRDDRPPCEEEEYRAAPPPEPSPEQDEGNAWKPDIWPPTKPGHVRP